MPEANNTPVPPPPPPQPAQAPKPPEQQAGELRAELAKVRSRSKLMTGIAVSLGIIFIILGGVVYVVYTKISAAKENIEQVFRAMPAPAAGYQPENHMLAGEGVYTSTSMPASTLGLFSGGVPGGLPAGMPANFDMARGEQAVKAMNKYANRPIVKEFLADLQKDPAMAEAFAASKGGNPFAVLSAAQNSKGMDKLMLKYSTRPEFLGLMMEVMNDPEMKPLMQGMPGGMPAAPRAAAPAQPAPRQQAEEEEEEGEMTFDPSAISGPAKTSAVTTKKVPSPVDSQ